MKVRWIGVIALIAVGALWLDAGSVSGAVTRLRSILAELSGTLVLFGVAAGARAAWLWWRGQQAASWPVVGGTITRARVESRKQRMGNTLYRQASKSTYYRPDLAYRYEVNGKTFEGKRARFGERAGWDKDAAAMKRLIDPYPEGHAVQVRYDPARPGEAVLTAGAGAFWRTIAVFATACLVLGVAGWFVG